jgi:hypothetical protein
VDFQSTIRNKTPQYGIFENYAEHQTIENQLLAISGTHLAIGLASETNGNIFSISAGGFYGFPDKRSLNADILHLFATY